VEKLGGKVERLTIDDMWQDTFYARLIVSVDGRWIDIDCRPSDGIAVALRAQAPIYVADEVLESCRLSEE
jgi:bifunctional DNase/RNase